jgi:hypothetical protein
MKDKLEVITVGSRVELAEDVHGILTAICIRENNNITYEVGFWNGRSYDSRWFTSHEIRSTDLGDKKKIGFV